MAVSRAPCRASSSATAAPSVSATTGERRPRRDAEQSPPAAAVTGNGKNATVSSAPAATNTAGASAPAPSTASRNSSGSRGNQDQAGDQQRAEQHQQGDSASSTSQTVSTHPPPSVAVGTAACSSRQRGMLPEPVPGVHGPTPMPARRLRSARDRLRALERASRPVPDDLRAAPERRWEELPARARTPAHVLGHTRPAARALMGCSRGATWRARPAPLARGEPRADRWRAHRARDGSADGAAAVAARAGPTRAADRRRGHAAVARRPRRGAARDAPPRPQAEEHVARGLRLRLLEALALDPRTGEPRFHHLSFAGHFDSMMFGRRGIRPLVSASPKERASDTASRRRRPVVLLWRGRPGPSACCPTASCSRRAWER